MSWHYCLSENSNNDLKADEKYLCNANMFLRWFDKCSIAVKCDLYNREYLMLSSDSFCYSFTTYSMCSLVVAYWTLPLSIRDRIPVGLGTFNEWKISGCILRYMPVRARTSVGYTPAPTHQQQRLYTTSPVVIC